MNEKKVILFIVEGPSDRAALGPIMEEYFNSEDIKFLIDEYSYAAEPPVQFRLSHLSRRSEPL